MACLVRKIQQGKAMLADLAEGAATQLGVASDNYAPCADSPQNCVDVALRPSGLRHGESTGASRSRLSIIMCH